eukprot:365524-Chlamydomonas_euryale.AAC.2
MWRDPVTLHVAWRVATAQRRLFAMRQSWQTFPADLVQLPWPWQSTVVRDGEGEGVRSGMGAHISRPRAGVSSRGLDGTGSRLRAEGGRMSGWRAPETGRRLGYIQALA